MTLAPSSERETAAYTHSCLKVVMIGTRLSQEIAADTPIQDAAYTRDYAILLRLKKNEGSGVLGGLGLLVVPSSA
jgi:hypothetical protein